MPDPLTSTQSSPTLPPAAEVPPAIRRRNHLALALFVLAKLCGILGLILMHTYWLSVALFAADATLLIAVVVICWRNLKATNLLPCEPERYIGWSDKCN